MSNRVIMMSSVTRGDYALCDRSAHKSTEQALTMTGVVPTYLVPRVVELLDKSIDRIHFDEAWYGYARFNESYTMHGSTSPLYTIPASNEVSAAMRSGVGGRTLTTESIREAVVFRKVVRSIKRDAEKSGDWFFSTWNADTVTDPLTTKSFAIEDAPDELLISEPDCWMLHPKDAWRGFKDIEDGCCMLDPIKVSVVSPGVALDGSFEGSGIPAMLVTAFLSRRGIPGRTAPGR